METLQYPIGKFQAPAQITKEHLIAWIDTLDQLPARLRALTKDLSDEQLDTPYRPEGWTVRQVVHHLADSHHNSYIRFKWALTEDNPVIKAYDEKAWTLLPDLEASPIEWSLRHLEVIHHKLVQLLKVMTEAHYKRTFTHPDGNKVVTLEENLGHYAWHSNHHYAHIENLVKRSNW